jgi:cell division protein FtsB
MRPQTDRDADVALVRAAITPEYHDLHRKEAAALDRLVADLNAAEARLAEVEAERDALKEEMEGFATWADSYPTSVFHQPDVGGLKRAREVLTAAGMTLDALSAMVYRHALAYISERARAALKAASEGEKP